MWISTRAQYGMRALVEIARNGDKPLSLKVVSERQKISYDYLEQLIAVLRKNGYLISTRGAYGGYRVSKPLNEITSLEIVELLEGGLSPVDCIENGQSCYFSGNCSTEPLWQEIDIAVRKVLSSTTLADLVAKKELIEIEQLPKQFTN